MGEKAMVAEPVERQSEQALLSVDGVSSGYGSARILQNVSFSVERHEILAIVGRNGVGKTTLMKTLIGLLRLMDGRIEFKGESIGRFRPSRRADRGIAYVPQGRGIFNRMSVTENLLLGQGLGGQGRKANYDRVYRFFPRLKERGSQKAGSMSGGEQQQLAIGRVLVGHPELILLDEPSEGIQPNIVQEIGQIIRRLTEQEDLTVIIVEQNLELIHSVADRCMVMDKGTIIAHVTPDEIADPEVAKRYLAIA